MRGWRWLGNIHCRILALMSQEQSAEENVAPIYFFKGAEEEVKAYRELGIDIKGELIPLDEDQETLVEILKNKGKEVSEGVKIDVYNPSNIFVKDGKEYIAGRVEPTGKKAEHQSVIVFFVHEGERWLPLEEPVIIGQDPNISWIGDWMVLSTVKLRPGEQEGWVDYFANYSAGTDFRRLSLLTEGPRNMKSMSMVKMADGGIGIYTRPQGEKKGGRGQIGFVRVNSLSDLAAGAKEIMDNAPLLPFRFPEGEWGGTNQAILLPDGRHLVIGHRAYTDKDSIRHYYPWSFIHDPKTEEVVDLGIMTERANFPEGPAKDTDLVDILYTSGVYEKDGKWYLITGISDTQAGMIEIDKRSEIFKYLELSKLT